MHSLVLHANYEKLMKFKVSNNCLEAGTSYHEEPDKVYSGMAGQKQFAPTLTTQTLSDSPRVCLLK